MKTLRTISRTKFEIMEEAIPTPWWAAGASTFQRQLLVTNCDPTGASDVRYWHLADIFVCIAHVRYRG